MFIGAHPTLTRSFLAKLLPQDVFAADPYTATGASANTRSLPFTPNFLWNKLRGAASDHYLWDSLRGNGKTLSSNTTAAEQDVGTLARIGPNSYTDINWGPGASVMAWAFKRASKFFDIALYIGNSAITNIINHSLGVIPGVVIFKSLSSVSSWLVFFRASDGNYKVLRLNTTGASEATASASDLGLTATTIAVNQYTNQLNNDGERYVAYLFAHDPDPVNGIIQCGSWTEQSAGFQVNLGWRPQFILFKRTDSASGWYLYDAARGWDTAIPTKYLLANTSDAENQFGTPSMTPNSTGFTATPFLGAGAQFVYLAIRAPI